MGRADAEVGTRHSLEVARLLEEAQRTKASRVAWTLGSSVLVPLGCYLAFGGIAAVFGGVFGLVLLGSLYVSLDVQADMQKRLKANLNHLPPVAFVSDSHGYVFINRQGIFTERPLGFVPFDGPGRLQGCTFHDHARLNGTRSLILERTSYNPHAAGPVMCIEVPLDLPAAPFRLLAAAIKEGRVRGALAELAAGSHGARKGAGRKRRRRAAGASGK